MNKKPHFIPVSKATAGMILSENLLDKLGHVLLPAGTALTEATIKAIAHHEIHHLAVLTDVNEMTEDAADSTFQQTKIARLDLIFRHAPYDEPTSLLKSYVVKYRRSTSS